MEREAERKAGWILILLIVLTSLVGIFSRGLWTPDEPRVTAVCVEMASSGDFIVPRLAGQPFLEKPPLGFAVGAGLIRIFGSSLSPVVAVRLASVFWGWGVLCFTFLLVRRLRAGPGIAMATLIVLATSWAFVENQHWIRVDSALAFFVLASVWSFAGTFVEERPWWAVPGAVFAAGAFLVKGPIGLVLILPAWLGMLYVWPEWRGKWKTHLVAHIAGGAVLTIIGGSWVYLLRLRGGPELFSQWFWVNQIGRATGSTVSLGHIHVGEPWYYLGNLVVMLLPWSPFFLFWMLLEAKKIWRKEKLGHLSRFALSWGLGSIFILSLPATKRDIYLLPALPVYALMAGLGFEKMREGWKKKSLKIWVGCSSFLVLLLLSSPFWARALDKTLRPEAMSLLEHWGVLHVFAALILVLIFMAARAKKKVFLRFAGVSILFLLLNWVFPARVIDRQKNLEPMIRGFVDQVPRETWRQVRGWELSETMRAFLYLYEDLEIRNCSGILEAERILGGQESGVHYLLLSTRSKSPLPEGLRWEVLLKGPECKRQLSLLRGVNEPSEP